MRDGPKAGRQSGLSPASNYDVVDGVTAAWVAKPRKAHELRAVMEEVAARKLAVVVRGAGTKIAWGGIPSRLDAVIDVSGLDRVTEHVVGDLVVRVEPGMRLANLQATLEQVGQRLSIDEVMAGSTIGGIVATGLSGPRRLAFGGVRDLLIGVSVIRADGQLARAGGKVVKNVAGYDLCKLYTGSYGTLGVISETVFRLHPVPAAAAWVSAQLADENAATKAALGLLSSQLAPVALELDWPATNGPIELSVLFEGLTGSVEQRCGIALGMVGASAAIRSSAPPWWATLPGPTTLKATTTISGVRDALRSVAVAAGSGAITASIRCSPGLGILYIGLSEDSEPEMVDYLLRRLRDHFQKTGGSVVVLRASAEIRAAVDVWGPVGALELMRRVKANFDPAGLLAPGRFVGGI